MLETCNLCPWHDPLNRERILYEGKHHSLFFPAVPMVYREDGGHVILLPKRHVTDVSFFTNEEAHEYMVFYMAAGKLMYDIVPTFGIDLGRVNYHDNGNLEADKKIGAHQHLHFYGRARSARHQKWKDNLVFPSFDPQNSYFKSATSFTESEKNILREKFIALYKSYASALVKNVT